MQSVPVIPYPFPWKLDPKIFKKSIFHGKIQYESVDINMLNGFIVNNMNSEVEKDNDDTWDGRYSTEVDQIRAYRNNYNNKMEIIRTVHYLPKHKWGRVSPKDSLSLSVFRRPTRHSFARRKYVDMDQVCSTPTIFCSVSEQNGLALPRLREYIDNCKAIRAEIMEHHGCDKEAAKRLPIRLTYGGSYDKWLESENITQNADNKMEFFVEFEKELVTPREVIFQQNQHILNDVLKVDPNKWRDVGSQKRGLMSFWCFTIERYVQELAVHYITKVGSSISLNFVIPCQDGMMVIREPGSDDEYYNTLCKSINEYVKEHSHIDMKFVVKPMDEGFEIPVLAPKRSDAEWTDQLSTRLLADRLIDKFGKQIMVTGENGDLEVMIYSDEKWEIENSKRFYALTKLISINLYEMVKEEIVSDLSLTEHDQEKHLCTLRAHTSKSTHINDIIRLMMSSIPKSTVRFDSNPFLLGFKNGVYDLRSHEFRKYRYDDFVTMSTGYDYDEPDFVNCEEDRLIRDELIAIFKSIHPDEEKLQLNLQILASGLDGIGYQNLFLFNGDGGNGKGFQGGLMSKTLGQYYYQPSNNIITDLSQDSSSASPDICRLRNVRYVNFQEVDMKINNGFVKKLTGGGMIRARMLRENPVEFPQSWTTVMEFNTAPKLTHTPGGAEERRCVNLSFNTIFTTDESKVGQEINGRMHLQADVKLVTEAYQIKARKVFLHMLLNVYKTFANAEIGMVFTVPKEVQEQSKMFLKGQDFFLQLFEQKYQFVEDKSVTVKLKDIWTVLSNSMEYKSLPSSERRELTQKSLITWLKKHTTVEQHKHNKSYLVCGVTELVENPDES